MEAIMHLAGREFRTHSARVAGLIEEAEMHFKRATSLIHFTIAAQEDDQARHLTVVEALQKSLHTLGNLQRQMAIFEQSVESWQYPNAAINSLGLPKAREYVLGCGLVNQEEWQNLLAAYMRGGFENMLENTDFLAGALIVKTQELLTNVCAGSYGQLPTEFEESFQSALGGWNLFLRMFQAICVLTRSLQDYEV